jgi:hypothetical protein
MARPRIESRARTRSIGALALMLALGGCATTPPAMPVSGSAADLSRLAGEWSGEYWGARNGRSGVITFHLEAGADSAFGSVLMIAGHAPRGAGTTSTNTAGAASQPVSTELTVRFVRAEGGGVDGRLDPYTDPECNCTAFTTFSGQNKGDVIEGTYTIAHGGDTPGASGKWKVRRRAP